MAKKIEGTFIRGLASLGGHVAGVTGAAIGAAVEVAHQFQQREREPVHEDVRFEQSDINSRGVIIRGLTSADTGVMLPPS